MYLSSFFLSFLRHLCFPSNNFFPIVARSMKFGMHIPYDVPYGGFESRADIPNSFGNRAFSNTQKAVYTTMAKHEFYIAFQHPCVQQMFTNADSTKISYDMAYVFS